MVTSRIKVTLVKKIESSSKSDSENNSSKDVSLEQALYPIHSTPNTSNTSLQAVDISSSISQDISDNPPSLPYASSSSLYDTSCQSDA